MASTYTALHYHIIFSTQGREPNISIEWRERLHQYLAGLARSLNGYADCIGGVADHVHMLVSLGADQRVSDFMREVKKRSSLWIHAEIGNRKFR